MKSTDLTPDNCDKEPIHIPAYIQPHGVLIAVRPVDLIILQISENSAQWLGESPNELWGQPLEKVIGSRNVSALRDLLDQKSLENNPHYAFSFVPKGNTGRDHDDSPPEELDVEDRNLMSKMLRKFPGEMSRMLLTN